MPISREADKPAVKDAPVAVEPVVLGSADDHPDVDPKAPLPAEVTPGHRPDPKGDKLLAAAQVKAPSLTREFADKHNLTDEYLAAVARGEESPPPAISPESKDRLILTGGGWVHLPPGVEPENANDLKISR